MTERAIKRFQFTNLSIKHLTVKKDQRPFIGWICRVTVLEVRSLLLVLGQEMSRRENATCFKIKINHLGIPVYRNSTTIARIAYCLHDKKIWSHYCITIHLLFAFPFIILAPITFQHKVTSRKKRLNYIWYVNTRGNSRELLFFAFLSFPLKKRMYWQF